MDVLNDITWLGHASFFLIDHKTGNKIYYIDPFQLAQTNLQKADIIFITHAHHDHFSKEDIEKLVKIDTTLVATGDVLAMAALSDDQKFLVIPNKIYSLKNFSFETVPAYNTKTERLSYHPQINHWVGYIFYLNGKKLYHAGDTDFISEMNELKNKELDVAFLPIGGTYTMDTDDAIAAGNAIGAKITIPMHYKMLLGEKAIEAEEKFKKGVTNSKVVILEELK